MVFATFLDGVFLGLSVAAPVGPVSLLCLQRSLASGSRSGVLTGMGAATAHGMFACLALLSADVAASWLSERRQVIHLISGAVLVVIGLRTTFRRGVGPSVAALGPTYGSTYVSAMGVALSNPMTILPYTAFGSASASAAAAGISGSFWPIPGVMIAAALWYCALSLSSEVLRMRLGTSITAKLNLIAGTSLVGLGLRIAFT